MFAKQLLKAVVSTSNNALRFASSVAADAIPVKRIIPRRSLLFVPGNEEAKINNIANCRADCIVLDCEDSVSANDKMIARGVIKKSLDLVDFGRTEAIVRVNSIKSGLANDDIKAILEAKRIPSTILLPKVEGPSDFEWLVETLHDRLRKINKENTGCFNALISIESALGLLNLESICRRAHELKELGVPLQLDGVVFGSNDYHTDIGAERSKDGNELMYARQKIITVAKAFDMQAIDMVHSDVNDVEGLRSQSLEGARIGFTGKQIVDPSQISIVQECFTPSKEKMEWASKVIEAYAEHQKNGKGVFGFQDKAIDLPLLKQAQNMVKYMENLEDGEGSKSSEASQ